jgi:hypothetical protein
MSDLTVSVLLYGNHPALAHRCLSSIWERLPYGKSYIFDIRLGLNEISANTRVVVDWFVEHVCNELQLKVIVYDCPQNAFKYPLMRRMLLADERRPGKYTMWFDDDSYLSPDESSGPNWWEKILDSVRNHDMIGKIYQQRMFPTQWPWIERQAWFNPAVGKPPVSKVFKAPTFRFCTGGWWAIKSSILLDNDWPTKELKLIGGDSMLGELCRHRGYSLTNFEDGVRINADELGRHSKAPGRGGSPLVRDRVSVMLGVLDTQDADYQNFTCNRVEH